MTRYVNRNSASYPTTATLAGLNITSINGNPSSLSLGDLWFNNNNFSYRDATTTYVVANLTGTQTFTNKTLTSPRIVTSILDSNGNVLFNLTATTSAVNNITYANSATGNAPSWSATGSDTNIGMTFSTKGSGVFTFNGALSLSTPLAITSGGTGANTAIVGFNNLSPTTTKGDLIVSDGTNDVRLAAGTDGYVLSSDSTQVSGLRWQDMTSSILSSLGAVIKEPTGFPVAADNTTSTLSFVNGTRTFSITPVGASFDVYVTAALYTKTAESIVISATEGFHYIYYNTSGVLSETTTFTTDLITSFAFIAVIYWDNTNAKALFIGDERHAMTMDGATHLYLHNTLKTVYNSGFTLNSIALGDGTLSTDVQFGVDAGSFNDEDINFSFGAISAPANIPIFYKEGATPVWRAKTADAFPLLQSGAAGYTGAAGRIAYNQNNAGTWQLTEVIESGYMNIHYYIINDSTQKIIGVMGDNYYTTRQKASDLQEEEIARITSLPLTEYILIGSVIYQTNSTYTNTPKAKIVKNYAQNSYTDWRKNYLKSSELVAFIQANSKYIPPILADIETEFETNFSAETVGAAGTLKTAVVGTGATAVLSTATPDFKVIPLITGTTATGSAQWVFANSLLWTSARNTTRVIEFDWQQLNTSSPTQRFTLRAGIKATSLTADGTGIYFRYSDNLNSGNIQCVVRNGAAETVVNTNITGVGFQRAMRINITCQNAVTSVYFYIDEDIQNGGVAITTNIPPDNTQLFVGCGNIKSIGTTSTTFYASYFRVIKYFTQGKRF